MAHLENAVIGRDKMETLILSTDQLAKIKNKYNDHKSDMHTLDCKELSFLTDVSWLDDLVNPETFVAANFYKHTTPMSPHVDQFNEDIRTTLIIPIESESNNHSVIVFDQTYSMPEYTPGCVWFPTADEDEPENEVYKRYKRKPCDTLGVSNCTDGPCPEELLDYIHEDPDFVYGLTGSVWSFTPGTALVFDTSRIHCTGKTHGLSKTGLVLWFNSSVQEVVTYWRKNETVL